MTTQTTTEPFSTRLAESGMLPDAVLRLGIRRLLTQRLLEQTQGGADQTWKRQQQNMDELKKSHIAIETAAANRQHYEVPAEFFNLCLGENLKYSCALWEKHTQTLQQAEENMLRLYQVRADLQDGQKILELGCGWGSLTLWMAKHYPNAKITAVSNSTSQRAYILQQCAQRGYQNVEVITADVSLWDMPLSDIDRVVSIEMFEHMRNYGPLMHKIAKTLAPNGKVFVHIFCHKNWLYPFETQGDDNWMGRYFFTGGIMPAADTLLHFQQDLVLDERWLLSGQHYEKTANAWLARQDANASTILKVFEQNFGSADAAIWAQRWRMFWMACAELFGYAQGTEWMVAHYRFTKRSVSNPI